MTETQTACSPRREWLLVAQPRERWMCRKCHTWGKQGESVYKRYEGSRPVYRCVNCLNPALATQQAGYRPGKKRCLKCGKPFQSWDVRRNRICPSCNANNAALSRLAGCAGAVAHVPMPEDEDDED